MGGAPNNPAGNLPPVPPFWRDEEDWIVLIEFLRDDDEQDRARGTEAIGYMLAYARKTNTRMLALVGSAEDKVYELLFSFDSPANKTEFLRLLQSNEATRCEEDEVLVPTRGEIDAAQPISKVLPADVLHQIAVLAAPFSGRVDSETIQ